MNPRTTVGLSIALIVALIGVWWAQSTSTPPEKKSDKQNALFDPALGDLAEFELVQSGGAGTLKFAMQDTKWRIVEPVSGPSEHFVVNGAAVRLKDLKFARSYPAGHSDRPSDDLTLLKSPPFVAKLTDKSGKSAVVKIGARQSLSRMTYVQRDADETVYLVDADLNAELKKDFVDWRGKALAEFTPEEAVRVEVSGGRQYTLVKNDQGWLLDAPAKSSVDQSAVSNLLRAASSLTALRFVDDHPKTLRPYGLESPQLVMVVHAEKKVPKPAPPPPATAPAEPEFEVTKRIIRLAFGGPADSNVFASVGNPPDAPVIQIGDSVFKQLNVPPSDLRDKVIAFFPYSRAERVEISAGGENTLLTKKDGHWLVSEGAAGVARPAEFAAVDDMLKTIRDMKALGFEDAESPAQALSSPRATIRLTAEAEPKSLTLQLGGATPSGTGAYLKNLRDDFVAVVARDVAEKLLYRPMTFLSRDLSTFASDRASRIQLDFDGWSCAAQKQSGLWRFVSPVNGMAESAAITNILTDLSKLRGRQVVGSASEAPKFGMKRPDVLATVTVDAAPKPPTSQPTSQTAVEPPGEPTIHTVLISRVNDKVYAMAPGGLTICEIDPKVLDNLKVELLDTKVLALDPSQVRKISYDGAAKFTFNKSGSKWNLEGEPSFKADAATVTDVLSTVRDVRAKQYARYSDGKPAEYGLDKPAAIITIEPETGDIVSLSISNVGPTGTADRYASVGSNPGRIFVIKAEEATKLLKSVSDFQSKT
jgi:hypothetical protein